MIFKFDEKDGSVRPDVSAGVVGGGFTLEASAVTDTLDDPRDVGGDTQLVHLLGHGDIVVGQGCIINDHVFAGVCSRLLEGIGRSGEQQWVEFRGQQVEERQQSQRSGCSARTARRTACRRRRAGTPRRTGAVEEQIQQFQTQGITLLVQSLFKVLDPLDAAVSVRYHLHEEVGEAGTRELGISGSVEVSVVDGLAAGWVAESRGGDGRGRCRAATDRVLREMA